MESLKTMDVFPISHKFGMVDDCHEVLKVPVIQGVLQVGVVNPKEFTNLTVTKDSGDIYIAREDKKPLQVEVHPLSVLDGLKSQILFDRPISAGLAFSYFDAPTANNLWNMDAAEALVNDRYALLRFTKEVAMHILLRQTKAKMALAMTQTRENALARSS